MFELFMFWVWVTVFVYLLIVPVVVVSLKWVTYYICDQLEKGGIPRRVARSLRDRIVNLTRKVHPAMTSSTSDAEDFFSGAIPILSGIAWFLITLYIVKELNVPDYTDGVVQTVALVANGLARLTFWLAPVVLVVGSLKLLVRSGAKLYTKWAEKLAKISKLVD